MSFCASICSIMSLLATKCIYVILTDICGAQLQSSMIRRPTNRNLVYLAFASQKKYLNRIGMQQF